MAFSSLPRLFYGQVYFTHDNGSRPFCVHVNGDKDVIIFSKSASVDNDEENEKSAAVHKDKDPKEAKEPKESYLLKFVERNNPPDWRSYGDFVAEFPHVKHIFLGESDPIENDHPAGDWGLGNTILLELADGQYVFVGLLIASFQTDEKNR